MHKHEDCNLEGGCKRKAVEHARITVPVAVRAFSHVEDVDIRCRGPAVITRNSDDAPGEPGAVSRFTVSQRLSVDIPLAFVAQADVGEGHVEFRIHDDDNCRDEDEDNDDENDCRGHGKYTSLARSSQF